MLHTIGKCGCCAVLLIIFVSCNRLDPKSKRPSFKGVEGIKFIEVRREFNTGYSFSEHGFQQVPEWKLYFLPGDSVKIYSPFEKRYIFYPIYFDHAQVINFAREWLRLIHVNKDSLVLQLLKVQSKQVNKELSTVYMRFYSEGYLNNVLHANADSLKKPKLKDTIFIRRLANRSNKHSKNADSLFSARKPVVFRSKNPNITAFRRSAPKGEPGYKPHLEYLNPEYDVEIKKAYKDFDYNFTVLVDSSGNMTVGSFAFLEKEFEAPRRRVLQGILDVYLEKFLDITPGSTLGIPHATEIMLHLRGIKN
ncbi:MAG: hypothetical protein H7Y13_05175 [Sphingobacteriaceae bacterium]|nr:hypothetical protein [Sphingobacteriaceae bacterium]